MAWLAGLRYCDLGGSLPPLGPARPRRSPRASALRYSSLRAGDSLGEEVLRMFLAERQMHGDFVSKISDMVWRRSGANLDASQATTDHENAAYVAQPENVRDDAMSEGVLRLAVTRDWVSGESSLTVSNRLSAKDRQNESDKRKELNFLRYEALKDELLLMTTGIGAACSLYCLLVSSMETAIGYAFGVTFSCLYLRLLYRRTDNLSKEGVPHIFLKKKVKKIGIRSEDLKNTIEKMLGGTAVSSFIPKLVPVMVPFFAYKAAALVQAYRDNEDLRSILPKEDADSS